MDEVLGALLIICGALVLLGVGVTVYYLIGVPAYYAAFPAFDYERDARVVVEATGASLLGFDQAKRTIYVKPEGDAYVIEYSVVVPEGFGVSLYSERDVVVNVYSEEKVCAVTTGAIKGGKLVVYVHRTGECPPTIIVEMKAKAALLSLRDGSDIGTYIIHDAWAVKEVEQADATYGSITVAPISLSYRPHAPAFMLPSILATVMVVSGLIALAVMKR